MAASQIDDAADFEAWLALGLGGISRNQDGYLLAKKMEKEVAFDDTLTLDFYRDPEKYSLGWSTATPAQKAAAKRSFLTEPLPQREGPQARANPFVFPQRQNNADVPHDEEVKAAYEDIFTRLGESNASTTEFKTSILEKQGRALFVTSPCTPLAGPTQGEICHIHGSDLSAHVTLSFPDAEEVLSKGWAERHRMSGSEYVHLGYTMVYVPRSVKEVAVLEKIFRAGVEYMRAA